MKQQHPGLDVNTEDIVEKSWTKRQKAASQLLKKFDAVSEQGPLVQSNVSLTSWLVVKMLLVLINTISNSQVFLLKKCE